MPSSAPRVLGALVALSGCQGSADPIVAAATGEATTSLGRTTPEAPSDPCELRETSAVERGQGPLRMRADGRALEHEDETPFFYLADLNWLLSTDLTAEDWEVYFEHRRRFGYTVLVTALWHPYRGGPDGPRRPFAQGEPSRLDRARFLEVDAMIELAAKKGLVLGLVPAFADALTLGTLDEAQAEAYGRALADRYAATPHVFWIVGGDTGLYADRALAIARGLRSGGDRHLLAFHPQGGHVSTDVEPSRPPLDLVFVHTGHRSRDIAPGLVRASYLLSPVRPVYNAEPAFERHPVDWNAENGYFDDLDVRKQAYWSVLSGASGVTYGNHSLWQGFTEASEPVSSFFGAPRDGVPWWRALDDPGSRQMGCLRRLFTSRPMGDLVPRQDLVQSPNADGPSLVTAALDRRERFLVAYVPGAKSRVQVTLDWLPSRRAYVWWFDPRTGTVRPEGTLDGVATGTWVSPSEGPDWVLVIDDAALELGPPGGP